MTGFVLIVAGACLFGLAFWMAHRARGGRISESENNLAAFYTDHRTQDDWSTGIPANPQNDAHSEGSDMPIVEN